MDDTLAESRGVDLRLRKGRTDPLNGAMPSAPSGDGVETRRPLRTDPSTLRTWLTAHHVKPRDQLWFLGGQNHRLHSAPSTFPEANRRDWPLDRADPRNRGWD